MRGSKEFSLRQNQISASFERNYNSILLIEEFPFQKKKKKEKEKEGTYHFIEKKKKKKKNKKKKYNELKNNLI